MRSNDALKVGVTVLLAAALMVFATFYLRGAFGKPTYLQDVSFTDAQGIQEGAYVRVLGVEKGSVKKIRLGEAERSVILTLRVEDDYRLKKGDRIRIQGGLLGFTQPYVEITPATAPGPTEAVLRGEETANTDGIMAQADVLMGDLKKVSKNMGDITENLAKATEGNTLRNTARNFEKLSESGLEIADNMKSATARADRLVAGFQSTASGLDRTLRRTDDLLTSLRGTAGQSQSLMRDSRELVQDTRGVVKDASELVRNTNTVVTGAGGLVTDTRAALAENRARLTEVLDNLNSSLKKLDGTLAEAQSFIADPELRGDLKATAANVKDATANLKKITADVEGLTGDPKVQEDLRATIAGLRGVTAQASEVFEKVRGVFGGGGKAAETAKSIGQRFSEADLDATLLRTWRTHRTRLDFDATIPWTDRTFYRLGFYDFGEQNKFTVQAGQRLRSRVSARYGVYASTLGFGLDLGNPSRPPFSFNVYGVDDPRVDVRGNVPLLKSLDFTFGFDNITRRADPIIGLRYRK